VPVINPLTLPVTLPAGFPGSTPPIDTAITCTNSGTFETRPTITIGGPISNPSVVNAATAQAITFTGLSMAATDQLVINTDARQAYLNGTFYPADVTSAWWVLDPGDTQVYLTGDNFAGGGTVTVQWASAWA
jgi:phage-related protein